MRRHDNRHRLLHIAFILTVLVSVLPACVPDSPPALPSIPIVPLPTETPPVPPRPYYLPQDGVWRLPDDTPTGRVPSAFGSVEIEGLGAFSFNPADVSRLRPEIFATGHFSVFDVVAHLADEGWFNLEYHFDPCLDTYVIDRLDGRLDWWYRAAYAGGSLETNAVRMDLYPYKDGMRILLATRPEAHMARLYDSFAAEVMRKSLNRGRVVIPEVRIGTVVHRDVPVSAHDIRSDVLRPGVVTALDVLLSLADQRHVDNMKLTWYANTDRAVPVDSYFVEQIDDGDGIYDGESSTEGGWVYETGSLDLSGFQGSHVAIPADTRIIVSPEYMTWYWLMTPR